MSIAHADVVSRRPGSSGSWLLLDEEYTHWRSCTSESCDDPVIETLWCPGPHGSGKTIAMSFVVDDLKEISEGADAAVAYFYCREQWQSSVQTKTGFLLNFARQLLDAAKDPVALATPFIDIRGHFKPDSINALLQSTIAEFTIVYLVIDALEKFSTSKDDRADLINSLRDISDGLEPGKLRICVTSTEADEIVDLLDDPLQIEISPNAEDIREYVAHELDAGSMRSDFLSESLAHHPHLRDKIINSIVDNNDGS